MSLRALPAPDTLEFTLPQGHCCLLLDDGSALSVELALALQARAWQVVLFALPADVVSVQERAVPDGLARCVLADMQETTLQAQLAAVAHDYGPLGAFIHLHPFCEPASATVEKTLLRHVFLTAKALQPALTAAAQLGRAVFMTVSRMDGALGLGRTHAFEPLGGGLLGLTKTLRLEWPAVFCRAVDLSPAFDVPSCVAAILAELHDPNWRLAEVGISEQGRVTLSTQVRPAAALAAAPRSEPTASALFVVSGGAKGITAQCVIALARRYRCRFVLLGRSTLTPEPDWAMGVPDEVALKQAVLKARLALGQKPRPVDLNREVRAVLSSREIRGTLSAVEAAGGEAHYLSVDVTAAPALREALQPWVESVTGIIHGAGVLADKLIEKKSAADFEKVYAVKVAGLQHLLACVPVQRLAHLILFSSVAGFYGNVGQADYALANEILNKMAQQLKQQHPHCRVLAFDWGPWDGGMVTPALKKFFTERHIEVIPPQVGAQMLVDEIAVADDAAQLVVGGTLLPALRVPTADLRAYRIERALTLEANPFLYDHVIGGSAVLPTVCAVAWMVSSVEQLYPGYTFFCVDGYKALKGIVFDATLAASYVLDLKEVRKDADEIVCDALVCSTTADGKPRYHYRAQVTLLRELPPAPHYAGFDAADTQLLSGEQLYSDNTLFHGPAFRGIERVLRITPEALTARCVLPEISLATQGQFPVQGFNPYLTDVQLQSLLVWAKHHYGYGGLPLCIARGEQYRQAAFGEETFACMLVQSATEHRLVGDVIVCDAQGLLFSRISGAEITLSSRLDDHFRQNRIVEIP